MGGFQPDQQMDVVLHTANTLRHATQSVHYPAKVFVQPWLPFFPKNPLAILGCEDEMIKQASMS